jgi:hypothetical protein
MTTPTAAVVTLRHIVATLVYRAAKTFRDTPSDFTAFRPAPGSRSAGEILAHVCDLLDWALSQAREQERWRDSKPQSWTADSARFFVAATALDHFLASNEIPQGAPEKLFQGALADALTHTGQIAMLRRLAGAPLRGENYSKARIEVGRTGADQNQPIREFD